MSVWQRAKRTGETSPDTRQAAGRRRPARWAAVAAWAVAGLILFACYWRPSWTALVNSDGAGNALQAWDMLHANLLLHGWNLSGVPFSTPQLPESILVELAIRLGANVGHVAAGATAALGALL